MELKYASMPALSDYVGSNCTFMELKYEIAFALDGCDQSSNCTFMELKLSSN